jgi:Leucine-rich repeat (LRR) protein
LKLPYLDVFDLGGNPFDYYKAVQFYYEHNPWKGYTKCVDEIRRTKEREKKSFYYFDELQIFPEELYELDQIQYLSFHAKHITELPAGIKGLRNLQYLDLSGNQLTHLPTDIRELENLHTVVLDRNNISAFPEIVLDVPNIKSISINDNHLTHLDIEILRDKRLTGFYALNNPLENINPGLFQLNLEDVRKRLGIEVL